MRVGLSALGLFVVAGLAFGQPPMDSTIVDQTNSNVAAALPLTTPLFPLTSGALTNVDATESSWRMIQQRLFTGDVSAPDEPWIHLERRVFGDYNALYESRLPIWMRTPDILIERQVNRYYLSPLGGTINR